MKKITIVLLVIVVLLVGAIGYVLGIVKILET